MHFFLILSIPGTMSFQLCETNIISNSFSCKQIYLQTQGRCRNGEKANSITISLCIWWILWKLWTGLWISLFFFIQGFPFYSLAQIYMPDLFTSSSFFILHFHFLPLQSFLLLRFPGCLKDLSSNSMSLCRDAKFPAGKKHFRTRKICFVWKYISWGRIF